MDINNLKKAYAAEFACLEKLEQLVDAEREALNTRNTLAIHETTETKQALLIQLESLDKQRLKIKEEVLRAATMDAELNEFIESNDQLLKSSLNKFQHENRINLGIVELGRIFTEQMISILRGQSRQNSDMYDLRGSRQKSILTKSLAKV